MSAGWFSAPAGPVPRCRGDSDKCRHWTRKVVEVRTSDSEVIEGRAARESFIQYDQD